LNRAIIFGAIVVAVVIVVSLVSMPFLSSAVGLGSNSNSLTLKQGGLESFYPENATNVKLADFSGSTGPDNSSYTAYDDSAYLHIGVKAPVNGSWAGYYQVTPSTYATLVHAYLVAPSNLTGYFTNGIYIQAADQAINYITCVSVTNSTGTYWMVVHGYKLGNVATNPTVYDEIWHDTRPAQPLSRDCVLVTNGHNALKVYLDHSLVYQSTSLSLGMQEPYNFFVGVESEYAHQLVYGSTRDFYVTAGELVNVTGLPSKATLVEVVDPAGSVLASSPVKGGTASLDLGKFSFPISGYIRAYDTPAQSQTTTNNTLVASTKLVSIFGGDVYSIGKASTTVQLTINSLDTNGNQLSGLYTVVSKDGTQVAADYLPTTFSLQSGQTYTISVANYGNYVFDHWSDGPISNIRTVSVSGDTSINAIFRNANAPPPSGHSIITVKAVDSSGKPLTGLYTTLWENGFIVAQGYTPTSFVVTPNSYYEVTMSNYGSHVFTGWQGNVNDSSYIWSGDQVSNNIVAIYR
jgi:hypothetical protein